MPTRCKYHEICGLNADADPQAGLCILHSEDPNKDKKEFEIKLEEHRKNGIDDYTYFVFPDKIFFNAITFKREADFSGATFTKEASFFGATFNKETNFNKTKFNKEANFGSTKFVKEANFRRSTFTKEANFRRATFTKEADFRVATFTREAYFIGNTFSEGACFSGAKFTKEGTFSSTKFNKVADFRVAAFAEEAAFHGATFTNDANFYKAKFTKEADFSRATFTEEANFRITKFTAEVNFHRTTFTKEADFCDATFTDKADFREATFIKGANFRGTIFERAVDFRFSNLFGSTIFIGKKDTEENKTKYIFKDVNVEFRNVDITPADSVLFRDADLSHCLFQGTRVDKIEFTGVKWADIRSKFGQPRTGLYDEKILLENVKSKKKYKGEKDDLNWEHIERVYRDLKKNHEENRDYERAGDFNYGEKEMRRKNPNTPTFHRVLLNFYLILSGYGERYLRPLGWSAAIFVACTIGYIVFGIAPENGEPLGVANTECWIKAALYSLQVMTLLRPIELQPTSLLSYSLKVVQSITAPIILGLFVLALRQRLRR